MRADLKEHRYSFAGLLDTLWDQTDLTGRSPRTLGDLVDALATGDRPICLLLHHFDAILGTPDLDTGFDVAFLDSLNALKNRGLSLLCITRRAHGRYVMMARSGERRVSTLVLEPEELAPLSQADIRTELDRCLPSLDADDLDLLADSLLRHRHPSPFWAMCEDGSRTAMPPRGPSTNACTIGKIATAPPSAVAAPALPMLSGCASGSSPGTGP